MATILIKDMMKSVFNLEDFALTLTFDVEI